MLALIKKNGKEYYSPVLVLHNNSWNSKLLVFDSNYESLIVQDHWEVKGRVRIRCVYILNSINTDWITIDKYSGKKDIIENKKLLKSVMKGKIPEDLYETYKGEIDDMDIKEWYPISNELDVETFNNLSYGMHDGSAVDIKQFSDYTEVHFDTTWSCQILMRFYGVEESNIIDYGPCYYSSYFEFTEDMMIFNADLCWEEEGIEHPFVKCKKIEYKLLKTENAFSSKQ